ncbi:MAG: hypothetical protein PHH01_01785 [Patescibacteria group bacterium]|nr:hypothetical protein [Patescibacteria group bacterium]
MKKPYLIILVIVILAVAIGLVVYFTSDKQCRDLNEKQCKKDDRCLSVLVPCEGANCVNQAVFKECKDKESK